MNVLLINVSNDYDTCASENVAPCQEQRLLHILEQGAHALARVEHLIHHLHVQQHEICVDYLVYICSCLFNSICQGVLLRETI